MPQTISRAARILAVVLATALLCVGLASCQSEQKETTATSDKIEVGTNDNAYALELSNSSGKSVVGIAIKLPGEETHGANLLDSSHHVANGESCIVYVPKGEKTDGTYIVEIKITFGDGGVSNLHYLDMEDFSSATLLLQGKVGYVSYQSKAAGRLVNTLELQTYYYNLEDPTAAARDAAEEEEEKRRLEKLEEDLKSYEEASNTANSTTNGTSNSATNEADNDEIQGSNVEDDPQEYESDDREYDFDE